MILILVFFKNIIFSALMISVLFIFFSSCSKSPSPEQLKFLEDMSVASEFSKLFSEGVDVPIDENQFMGACKLMRNKNNSDRAKSMYSDGSIFFTQSSKGRNGILIKANGYDGYKHSFIFINDKGIIGPVYMSKPFLESDLKY